MPARSFFAHSRFCREAILLGGRIARANPGRVPPLPRGGGNMADGVRVRMLHDRSVGRRVCRAGTAVLACNRPPLPRAHSAMLGAAFSRSCAAHLARVGEYSLTDGMPDDFASPTTFRFAAQAAPGAFAAVGDDAGALHLLRAPDVQSNTAGLRVSETTAAVTTAEAVMRPRARWQAHRGCVFDLVWTHGDRRMVTASGDDLCHVWDVETRQLHATLAGHLASVKCVRTQHSNHGALRAPAAHTSALTRPLPARCVGLVRT